MSSMPHLLFHVSREDRLAFARERYFEEGLSPAGIVSDAVMQSWARCLRSHTDPRERVEFDFVTQSRAQLALQRNRPLLQAWQSELGPLESALAGTHCAAMLTDATGVLIASVCAGRSHERIMPVATRIGVNLSEEAVGTTAPGVVVKTGQPVTVMGAEHYFDQIRGMQCAAVPIRDVQGAIAGVLDISSEQHVFDFDAGALVALYAAAIENRLLLDHSHDHLVLAFQVYAPLLDTPMVGLAGINSHGRVAWSNGVAARLLGLKAKEAGAVRVEDVLGVGVGALSSAARESVSTLRLASGLTVWMRSKLPQRDGYAAVHAITAAAAHDAPVAREEVDPRPSTTAAPESDGHAPVSLRESDVDLIARTLRACKGNVSAAARQLGVSRGLVYRRLKLADFSSQPRPCAETEQERGRVIPNS